MKIYNVEQGTLEWFEVRKFKMTASNAQAIGNQGKGLDTYIYEVVAEAFTLNTERYTNEAMERGKELEAQARALYELETGKITQEVGFCEYSQYVGCSPDGLTEKGGIEIKCLNDVKHIKTLINGAKEIESAYVWQIQMNLLITGREWWDYVQYNPNFEKSLFIHRITPDKEMHDKLLKGFEIGAKLLEERKKYLTT